MASRVSCKIHVYHRPEVLRIEQHHVVPRAWQALWRPYGETEKIWVWDDRTVPLCPTGHSNLHFLLVRIMKQFQYDAEPDQRKRVYSAARSVRREYGNSRSLEYALLAPLRWLEWGGDLNKLVESGSYGYGMSSEER